MTLMPTSLHLVELFASKAVAIFFGLKCNMAILRGCLVSDFKPLFSVFKQYFMYFKALFHPHVFSQIFLNNNFQFLNTRTKWFLIIGIHVLFGICCLEICKRQKAVYNLYTKPLSMFMSGSISLAINVVKLQGFF